MPRFIVRGPYFSGYGCGMADPQRPAAVPAAARWSDDASEWQLAETDAEGRKHGRSRGWRADGTLRFETPFLAGKAHGLGRLFHPDGSVARELPYDDGLLDGTVTARAADMPRAEPLQGCCVPPGAWQMQLDYQRGTLAGWEIRAYLLEKWNRRCAYCGTSNQALEIEHLVPGSRGGSMSSTSARTIWSSWCGTSAAPWATSRETSRRFPWISDRRSIWRS